MNDALPETSRGPDRARSPLIAALLALAAVYAAWYRDDPHRVLAMILFVLPPLTLAIGVAARRRTASFWAGVLALLWFAHGTMLAWAEPQERGYALAVLALSVVVVFASSMRGLMARFSRRPRPPEPDGREG